MMTILKPLTFCDSWRLLMLLWLSQSTVFFIFTVYWDNAHAVCAAWYSICFLRMSSLDAIFNIFPVTSHVTADDVGFCCRLMSVSFVRFCFFFPSWAGFVVWGAYFILCGLLYFVKIISISLLSRSLGHTLSSFLVRRVCKIAIIDY
jgi:hypothetical protein